jgi:hypothetical protein
MDVIPTECRQARVEGPVFLADPTSRSLDGGRDAAFARDDDLNPGRRRFHR